MRGRIYLHIRRNKDIIAYVDAVIVHKGAVHIDNDFIANKYILPVFAMEIDVNVHPLAHASEQFPQQGLLAIRVGIVRSMQHSQQTPCPQSHFRNFRVLASVERLTRQAFLVFGFHPIYFIGLQKRR